MNKFFKIALAGAVVVAALASCNREAQVADNPNFPL